jgi:hypothetical protein
MVFSFLNLMSMKRASVSAPRRTPRLSGQKQILLVGHAGDMFSLMQKSLCSEAKNAVCQPSRGRVIVQDRVRRASESGISIETVFIRAHSCLLVVQKGLLVVQ